MSDIIQKVIEYKITGNPSDFNKVVQDIERMSGKQPINLKFQIDTNEIKGQLGEINSIIKKITSRGKDNTFAVRIDGMDQLQDRLKQIDTSVQSLATHFTGLSRSIDFSSEIDKNAKALSQMNRKMQESVEQIQRARRNRMKTPDEFFAQNNTRKNIGAIMDGADLDILSQKSGSNFQQIVEQIVLASSTTEGLNKQIQLTEDRTVSLQEVFSKLVQSISGVSISDFLNDGNFNMSRVDAFIDEFGRKISTMDFSPALQNAFKNMFSTSLLNSQAGVLKQEFDAAVEREKLGQINVSIDNDSIQKLSDAIGQLKAVIGEGDNADISFGIKAEDIQPVVDALDSLNDSLTNIHQLLNSFAIPKIDTQNLDDAKNKVDDLKNATEKLKTEDNKGDISSGWSADQIESVIKLLGDLKEDLKSIADGNTQEAITQRFVDMGTEISAVVLKLGELKEAFENIDFNMTIKTGSNPVLQNTRIAKEKRGAANIYKSYAEDLFFAASEYNDKNDTLRKMKTANGESYISAITESFDMFNDRKPKSASGLYDYYAEMVGQIKKLLTDAGIDISAIINQYEPQIAEFDNRIVQAADTTKDVEQVIRSVFGGNVNIENSFDVGQFSQQLGELKTVLEQLQQVLATGLGVDLNQQGPVFTYFDKLLAKIQEITEAVNQFSITMNNVQVGTPTGVGSMGSGSTPSGQAGSAPAKIAIHANNLREELGRTETFVGRTDDAYITEKHHMANGESGQVTTSIDTVYDYKKASDEAAAAQERLQKAIDSTNASLDKQQHKATELNKDLLNGIKLPTEKMEELKKQYEDILTLINDTRSAHATDGALTKVESTNIDNAIDSFKNNIAAARQNQRIASRMEADTPDLFIERWKTGVRSLLRDMKASKAETAQLEEQLNKLFNDFDENNISARYLKEQNAKYKKIQQQFYDKQDEYNYDNAEVKQAQTALKNYEDAVERLVVAKQKLDNPDGKRSRSALVEELENAQKAADLAKQKLDEVKDAFNKDILSSGDKSAFNNRINEAMGVHDDPTTGKTYQRNKELIVSNFQKELEIFERQYNDFVNNASGKFFGDRYDESVNNIRSQMQQLLDIGINVENIDLVDPDDISRAKELLRTMKETLKAANKDAGMLEANPAARSGLLKNIGTFLNKNTRLPEDKRSALESLYGQLQGNVTVQQLDEIKTKFNEISAAAARAGQTGRSFSDTLTSSFRNLSRYLLSFASFYRIIGTFKQAVTVVKELDSALMEVRKVSDQSLSSLQKWQQLTFDQANSVGGTAKQIEESTAAWLRLGKSFTEAQEAAQASVKLLNVSEFTNIDDATTSLVSMRQAFTDLSYDDFIDKLNGVGDHFSSSTDQLAYGMRNVSSVLKVAGNDIDQSLALLTAANDVTQDMSKASMGVRTVALRISGTQEAKQELEDLGEDVSDFVVQTQSKVDAQVRKYTATAANPNGVSVLDENGRLRSTYDILRDISEVYSDIVAKDNQFGTNTSNALLELLGGKTRSNILASILMNPQVLQDAYEQSQNSQGIGQRELDIYLDSIEAKLTKLQNRLQELASVTINSQWLKDMLDLGTGVVGVIADIVKGVGSLNTVIGVLGGIMMQKAGKGFLSYNRNTGFTSILSSLGGGTQDVATSVKSEFSKSEIIPREKISQDVKDAVKGIKVPTIPFEGEVEIKDIEMSSYSDFSIDEFTAEFVEASEGVDNLSEAMTNGSDVMQNVGYSAKYAGSSVSEMARQIQNGASAMTMLKNIGGTLLSTFVNIGVTMLASFAFSKMVEGIVYLITYYDKLIERGKKAKETIDSTFGQNKGRQDAIQNIGKSVLGTEDNVTTAKSIDAIAEKYAKLHESVNSFTNDNISLTNDDYAEYISLCNQIAEQFPSLIKGYDDQGNAVLNLGNSAQTAKDSLSELLAMQQLSANVEIGNNLDDIYAGLEEEQNRFNSELGYQNAELERLNKVKFTPIDVGTNYVSIDAGHADELKKYIQEQFDDVSVDLKVPISYDSEGKANIQFNNLANKSAEDIQKVNDYLQTLYGESERTRAEIMQTQQASQMQIEDRWASMTDAIGKYLQTSKTFTALGDEIQSAIIGNIASIDTSKIGSEYGGKTLDFIYGEIIEPLSNLNEQQQIDISKLFNISVDSKTISEYRDSIMSVLTDVFGEDEAYNQFELLGFQDILNELIQGRTKIIDSLGSKNLSEEDVIKILGLSGKEIKAAVDLLGENTYESWGKLWNDIQNKIKDKSQLEPQDTLSDIFSDEEYKAKAEEYEKALSSLSSALETLRTDGKLTAEAMRDLQEQFPNLTDFSKEGIQKAASDELGKWISDVAKGWKDLTPDGIKELNTYVQNLAMSYGDLGVSAETAQQAIYDSMIDPNASFGKQQGQSAQANAIVEEFKKRYGEDLNWEVVWMLALEDRFSDPAADIYSEYNDAVMKWEIQVDMDKTKKEIEKNLQDIAAERSLVEAQGSVREAMGLDADNYSDILTVDDKDIKQYTKAVANTYEEQLKQAQKDLDDAIAKRNESMANNDWENYVPIKEIERLQGIVDYIKENKGDIDRQNLEAQANLENAETKRIQDIISQQEAPINKLSNSLTKLQDDAQKTQNELTDLENRGLHGTEEQYNTLIANADEQLANLQRQKENWQIIAAIRKTMFGEDSTLYTQALQKVSEAEQQMIDTQNNQSKWDRQPLVDQLTDQQNEYNDLQTKATKIQEDLTKAETRHQKVSEGMYKNLISNGNKQIDNLKEQRDTLVELQRKVANGSSDWREYQSQIDSIDSSIASMQNDQIGWFESMTSIVSANASTLASTLSSAFSEINSETGLTIETMNELEKQFSDLEGRDISGIFYQSADGMKLNVSAAEDLVDAEYELQTNNLYDVIAEQKSILDQYRDSESATAQEAVNAANTRIDAANRELAMLQALYDEQKKQFSDFQTWQTAQSTGNAGDRYTTIQSALEGMEEARKKGLTGTDEFEAFTSMIDEWGANTVDAYDRNIARIKKYFTEDETGLASFFKDAVDKGFGTFSEEEGYVLDIPNVTDFGHEMGLSQEMVDILLGRAEDYGVYNDWVNTRLDGEEKVKEKMQELADAQLRLNELEREGASQEVIDEQKQVIAELEQRKTNLERNTERVASREGKITDADLLFGQQQIESLRKQFNEGIIDKETFERNVQQVADESHIILKPNSFDIDKEAMNEAFPEWDVKVKPVLASDVDVNADNAISPGATVNDSFDSALQKTKENWGENTDAAQGYLDVLSGLTKEQLESIDMNDGKWDEGYKDAEVALGGLRDMLGLSKEEGENLVAILEKLGVILPEKTYELPKPNTDLNTTEAPRQVVRAEQMDRRFEPQKITTTEEIVQVVTTKYEEGAITPEEIQAMSLETFNTTFNVQVQGEEQLQEVKNTMAEVAGSDGVDMVVKLDQSTLDALKSSNFDVTANTDKAKKSADEAEKYAADKKPIMKIGADTTQAKTVANNANLEISNMQPQIKVKANDTILRTSINNALLGPFSINVRANVTGMPKKAAQASGTMLSPAHASGTAYNTLNTIPMSSALASGKVGLEQDENALVNELGTESLIRDGQWYLIPGGMHTEQLKKGDIILNHRQTDSLIKHGQALGHGKAYADGSGVPLASIPLGPAHADEAATTTRGFTVHSSKVIEKAAKKNQKENEKVDKQNRQTKKDNTKKTKNTNKALDKFNKWLEKLVDWIDNRVDTLNRTIERFKSSAELATNTLGKLGKNSKIQSAMDTIANLSTFGNAKLKTKKVTGTNGVTAEIAKKATGGTKGTLLYDTMRGAVRYQQQADAVMKEAVKDGLFGKNKKKANKKAADIAKLIQTGEIDIRKYNKNIRQVISSYEEWYNKSQEMIDSTYELKQQYKELEQTKLDNIVEEFESHQAFFNAVKDASAATVTLNEGKGLSVADDRNKSLYDSQIKQQKLVSSSIKDEMTAYSNEMKNALKVFGKDSNEYRAAQTAYEEMKKAYTESETARLELEKQKFDLDFTPILTAIDKIQVLADKLKDITSIKEARGTIYGEKGTRIVESDYQQQITNNNDLILEKIAERNTAMEGILRGDYQEGNGSYEDYKKQIDDADASIRQLIIDNEGLKDAIVALRWKPFEDLQKSLKEATSDYEHLRGLLNDNNFFDQNGDGWEFTKEGLANLALIGAQIRNNEQQVADYQEALKKLDKEYKNKTISEEEYMETSREYIEIIQDTVDNNKNLKDSLVDLYKTQITNENNALTDLISKRKEALSSKKAYYDYDKRLRQQNDDIARLRAQAAALQGVTNDASRARLARINQELAEKQRDLDEEVANHRYDVQSDGYDKLQNAAQESLENTIKMIQANTAEQEIIIRQMLGSISKNYDDTYEFINQKIQSTGTVISTTAEEIIKPDGELEKFFGKMRTESEAINGLWDAFFKQITSGATNAITEESALNAFLTVISEGTSTPNANWTAFMKNVAAGFDVTKASSQLDALAKKVESIQTNYNKIAASPEVKKVNTNNVDTNSASGGKTVDKVPTVTPTGQTVNQSAEKTATGKQDDAAAAAAKNKAENDKSAANKVTSLLAALKAASKITLGDKSAITNARAAYNKLTADQKKLITSPNLKKLTDAEAKIKSLEADKKAAEQKAAEAEKALANAENDVKDKKALYDSAVKQKENLNTQIQKLDSGILRANPAIPGKDVVMFDGKPLPFTQATKMSEDLKKQMRELEKTITKYKSDWDAAVKKKNQLATANASAQEMINDILKSLGNTTAKSGGKIGYRKGSKSTKDELNWLHDSEVVIRKTDGAILQPFNAGDMVFTSKQSENLWKMSQIPIETIKNMVANPDMSKFVQPGLINKLQRNEPSGQVVNYYYDSLIHIDGNVDAEMVDKIEELAQRLLKNKNFMQGQYKYTTKELTREANKLGYK